MAAGITTANRSIAIPGERAASTARIVALDALRGAALLLMALDHASFFVGAGLQAESYGGQPVTLQSAPYWMSGLLTNLASPIFFLLGGYSLALYAAAQRRKGRPEHATTRYILIRAGLILALDLTICNLFWRGATPYVHVLTAIATTMVLLSLLRFLPPLVLAGISLTVLGMHQIAIGALAGGLAAGEPQPFWQAFWLTYSYDTRPALGFAVLGWGPLLWLGYAVGTLQGHPALLRPRTWVAAGISLLAFWLALRLTGGIGDLGAFGVVGSSAAHFLVMSKAPPSLTFFAFNLGIAALMLAGFYAWPHLTNEGPLRWLVLVGQVSLFFYVTHIVIYNLVSQMLELASLPGPRIIWGYAAWLIGLAVLLPLGASYRGIRKRYPRVLGYL
ncbi:MAG: heparan-alpha-glucosaminide N-acetyltransferase domain-containing protein [Oscillochloridaceae bacterium]|nr:heparan-alpha-glucosaminide N-acetyltransferase domain-containing protein [Chloroflexaceae bacterium]MDW8389814.1 heparan-alpha-glucosaminide N-acetyltransferase domain-containing protein [Oscillochloridaceae bacterium]